MARIRCFLLEPTGRVLVKLRRYSQEQGACPLYGYHDASAPLEEEPARPDPAQPGYILNTSGDLHDHADARWPTACACGYVFRESDEWQRFVERIYKRADTGEEMTLRDAPAGAMWEAWWFDDSFVPQGAHNLAVKTPGGDWLIDSQASNCSMPEDRQQKQHHCWIRHGTPPDVTVNKEGGQTCAAGAGSIQCGPYHGFLRQGYLED